MTGEQLRRDLAAGYDLAAGSRIIDRRRGMFTIRGERDGETVEVTWYARGERVAGKPLRGDPEAIEEARQLAKVAAEIPITPTGPTLYADLDDPVSALVTLRYLPIFRAGHEVEGDVPDVPVEELPEGAIP